MFSSARLWHYMDARNGNDPNETPNLLVPSPSATLNRRNQQLHFVPKKYTEPNLALALSCVYILDFIECVIVIKMRQNRNTKSVTIDKRAVPSRRLIKIQGLGLDGMRFETAGVDR